MRDIKSLKIHGWGSWEVSLIRVYVQLKRVSNWWNERWEKIFWLSPNYGFNATGYHTLDRCHTGCYNWSRSIPHLFGTIPTMGLFPSSWLFTQDWLKPILPGKILLFLTHYFPGGIARQDIGLLGYSGLTFPPRGLPLGSPLGQNQGGFLTPFKTFPLFHRVWTARVGTKTSFH